MIPETGEVTLNHLYESIAALPDIAGLEINRSTEISFEIKKGEAEIQINLGNLHQHINEGEGPERHHIFKRFCENLFDSFKMAASGNAFELSKENALILIRPIQQILKMRPDLDNETEMQANLQEAGFKLLDEHLVLTSGIDTPNTVANTPLSCLYELDNGLEHAKKNLGKLIGSNCHIQAMKHPHTGKPMGFVLFDTGMGSLRWALPMSPRHLEKISKKLKCHPRDMAFFYDDNAELGHAFLAKNKEHIEALAERYPNDVLRFYKLDKDGLITHWKTVNDKNKIVH
ncbi:hypothetical protein [Neptuniibacter sp. QD37_11]|uniref:hypothetical protein n=1 Tax=Neptuniibacter sp. QD37_11 TaxID=3398209 RepID=UPI0039F635C1